MRCQVVYYAVSDYGVLLTFKMFIFLVNIVDMLVQTK